MAYELTGKIKLIQEAQTFDSGFSKREVIVETVDGEYSQEIAVEFHKDKIKLLDDLAAGDEVTIRFNLRGREWEGHNRWFNSLVGWKLEAGENAQPENDRPPLPNDELPMDKGDDIPF